jgi:hypothetical protein
MDERGKSDGCVVPAIPLNNAPVAAGVAEAGEERRPAKGEHGQQNSPRTLCRTWGVQCAGACAGSST